MGARYLSKVPFDVRLPCDLEDVSLWAEVEKEEATPGILDYVAERIEEEVAQVVRPYEGPAILERDRARLHPAMRNINPMRGIADVFHKAAVDGNGPISRES